MPDIAGHRPQTLLALAEQAARCTRDILLSGRQERRDPLAQLGRDIKLSEDGLSETRIREFLASRADPTVTETADDPHEDDRHGGGASLLVVDETAGVS